MRRATCRCHPHHVAACPPVLAYTTTYVLASCQFEPFISHFYAHVTATALIFPACTSPNWTAETHSYYQYRFHHSRHPSVRALPHGLPRQLPQQKHLQGLAHCASVGHFFIAIRTALCMQTNWQHRTGTRWGWKILLSTYVRFCSLVVDVLCKTCRGTTQAHLDYCIGTWLKGSVDIEIPISVLPFKQVLGWRMRCGLHLCLFGWQANKSAAFVYSKHFHSVHLYVMLAVARNSMMFGWKCCCGSYRFVGRHV